MTALLCVLGGGFLGGCGRFLLAQRPGDLWGTGLANAIACLVLGACVAAPAPLALLAGTGFAGALSTWSTLASELGGLIRGRRWGRATAYLAATVVAGLLLGGVGTLASGLVF